MSTKETKKNIIQAGQVAVKELIKVAKEPIIDYGPDISADRLKNAFEILNRIEEEKNMLEDKPKVEEKKKSNFKGFAEGRSK